MIKNYNYFDLGIGLETSFGGQAGLSLSGHTGLGEISVGDSHLNHGSHLGFYHGI